MYFEIEFDDFCDNLSDISWIDNIEELFFKYIELSYDKKIILSSSDKYNYIHSNIDNVVLSSSDVEHDGSSNFYNRFSNYNIKKNVNKNKNTRFINKLIIPFSYYCQSYNLIPVSSLCGANGDNMDKIMMKLELNNYRSLLLNPNNIYINFSIKKFTLITKTIMLCDTELRRFRSISNEYLQIWNEIHEIHLNNNDTQYIYMLPKLKDKMVMSIRKIFLYFQKNSHLHPYYDPNFESLTIHLDGKPFIFIDRDLLNTACFYETGFQLNIPNVYSYNISYLTQHSLKGVHLDYDQKIHIIIKMKKGFLSNKLSIILECDKLSYYSNGEFYHTFL